MGSKSVSIVVKNSGRYEVNLKVEARVPEPAVEVEGLPSPAYITPRHNAHKASKYKYM